MAALLDKLLGRRPQRDRAEADRRLLLHMEKEMHAMALDVTRLNAAVAKVAGDVNTLVAAHADPAGQAAVDAAATTLEGVAAIAEAAAAPAPAPAPAVAPAA